MKCPTCPDSTLTMSERQSVEIDYCPQCRGVWLDRGELDKLLDRSNAQEPVRAAAAPDVRQQSRRPDFVDSDYNNGQGQRQYRKKSWLSEIFD
ncbi:zf-TFIIB domain-containing protein [Aquabacterium sp.]|uniref:TFIIB-type zinc ribbon-containing protein n=1 Tax=Aquabacterium sp. TaxID=1872578 RepID=UPI0019ADF93A|nr:zf-TFIIB domain-containing protein [Aquabacterium sp.]MBC7700335.1 zf-TFIIB domain-containing protein [Aquabacterium sp.]